MSLKTFFSLIAPSTEKRRLLKTMEVMYDDIDKVIMPSLAFDDNLVRNTKTYHRVNSALEGRDGPDNYRSDMVIRFLREGPIQTMIDEGPAIMRIVEKSFEKDIEVDGLDYKRANLIQYVTGMVFFVEYISKLTFVVSAEASENPMTKKKLIEEYRDFITNYENLKTFVALVNVYSIKAKKLSEALDKLQGVSFDPRTHDAVMKVNKNIDPLSMNIVPGVGHLALLYNYIVNSIDERRMMGLKDRLTSTKMQILYLQRMQDGELTDEERESIEKQIRYYQGQVGKIEAKIESLRGE